MCSTKGDKVIDIEAINEKLDAHIAKKYPKPTEDDMEKLVPMINKLLSGTSMIDLKREYKYSNKKSFLYSIFLKLYHTRNMYNKDDHNKIKSLLKIKPGKSHSGIISITIFTSPEPEYTDKNGVKQVQKFSCAYNCSYCPNEPGQPRSYLKGEPGVLRANREEFNCIRQMYIRMEALYLTGHEIDKLEVLVLGGTWTSYPPEYREEFIRDMYYAANTFNDHLKNIITGNVATIRDKYSLQQEKDLNKTAECKVIGLTLETRPDTITLMELINFRKYGCTRIQLGIQHLDDEILDKINRKCSTKRMIEGIKLLKNCGFKIDGHYMPNLPGSNPAKDEEMFDKLLGVAKKTYIDNDEKWELKYPEYQVDQWKIYPTTITAFTEIKKWYEEGSYIPYGNEELFDLLYKVKSLIFPWIRLNRCIRDISGDYVPQEDYQSNMRQYIKDEMRRSGIDCQCIRCREVKLGEYKSPIYITREYNASQSKEYFISCESEDKKTIYGFLRLRLVQREEQTYYIFPELRGAALIRELHVYSEMQPVAKTGESSCQHKGIGKRLMSLAENVATKSGYKKISVIAGQGVKGYYEKLGYINHDGSGDFMIKSLEK